MKSSFSDRRILNLLRGGALVAALVVSAARAQASSINIAPSGTGTIGQTADPALNGTENDHAGSNTNINDNNLGTHVDNYPGGPDLYVGVLFSTPENHIQSVGLVMAMFVDGGWFGPSNTFPTPGTALVASDVAPPVVQVTTNGINWTTVPSTNNYVTQMTGDPIGGGSFPNPNNSLLSTFTLNTQANGVEGIRLLGNGGGHAGYGGFIGVAEMYVTQVPEPSTLILAGLGAIALLAAARRRRA